MTTKDIRDIAAYWGAKFSYEIEITVFNHRHGELKVEGLIPMDSDQPYWLTLPPSHLEDHLLGSLLYRNVRSIKLHLRKLSSLTDAEVRQLANVAEIELETIKRTKYGIVFRSKKYSGYEPELTFDDGIVAYTGWTQHGEPDDIIKPYEVCAYLQSISVYVPGTISQEFVSLIN